MLRSGRWKFYWITEHTLINVVTAWQQNDNKVSWNYVEYIECVQKWTDFDVNINDIHSETNIYDRVRINQFCLCSPAGYGVFHILLLSHAETL